MQQLLIVKIGDSDRPAQAEDIEDAQKQLSELINSEASTNVWVTHHAVNVTVVPLGEYGSDEIRTVRVLGMETTE